MAYLHNRKPYSLIHRDIKPTNIILSNSKVAKITDFGLSKFYSLTKTFSNTNLAGLDGKYNELYENDIKIKKYYNHYGYEYEPCV